LLGVQRQKGIDEIDPVETFGEVYTSGSRVDTGHVRIFFERIDRNFVTPQ